ncbi:hypothetical protein LEA_05541, partial [human gut metagenome]
GDNELERTRRERPAYPGFRLEDITQYYTEEELGPAYEYAGEKIRN